MFVMINIPLISLSQTHNNDIEAVRELNIYGSNNKTIIGTAYINNNASPAVLFRGITQEKTNDSEYVTRVFIISSTGMPMYNVRLQLLLNKPAKFFHVNASGISYMTSEFTSDDKKKFEYKAKQVMSGELDMKIISKEPIKVELRGVDGIAK